MTDHARTTTHARPRMTDHARTTAHDRARLPYLFEEAVPTPPQGGLNCLARLALARERTPSFLNVVLVSLIFLQSKFILFYQSKLTNKLRGFVFKLYAYFPKKLALLQDS